VERLRAKTRWAGLGDGPHDASEKVVPPLYESWGAAVPFDVLTANDAGAEPGSPVCEQVP
jgi:hypothetical protein